MQHSYNYNQFNSRTITNVSVLEQDMRMENDNLFSDDSSQVSYITLDNVGHASSTSLSLGASDHYNETPTIEYPGAKKDSGVELAAPDNSPLPTSFCKPSSIHPIRESLTYSSFSTPANSSMRNVNTFVTSTQTKELLAPEGPGLNLPRLTPLKGANNIAFIGDSSNVSTGLGRRNRLPPIDLNATQLPNT